MTIERGTTQEVAITIKGWNLTGCGIYVTFKQGSNSVTKNVMDSVTYANNATKIVLTLTQRETLSFEDKRSGLVQVRWIDASGTTYKTKTAEFDVDVLLYDAVLTYEGSDGSG